MHLSPLADEVSQFWLRTLMVGQSECILGAIIIDSN